MHWNTGVYAPLGILCKHFTDVVLLCRTMYILIYMVRGNCGGITFCITMTFLKLVYYVFTCDN